MSVTLKEYIAGALGGAAGLIVGHPFDTTKVQLQTMQLGTPYKNTWQAIMMINRSGSFSGFYRGITLPLASYAIVNSVFFGVYGNVLNNLRCDSGQPLSFRQINVAGGIAGFLQVFVACPVEVIKIKMQSQLKNTGILPCGYSKTATYYKNTWQCLISVYRTDGFRGFYTGFLIQTCRDVPASILYFAFFEKINLTLIKLDLTDSRHIISNLLAGGLAGVLSWLPIMPIDAVKSLYQAYPTKYNGLIHCASAVYSQRGWRGFFTGTLATCLRAFPLNAVTFVVYNQALSILPFC